MLFLYINIIFLEWLKRIGVKKEATYSSSFNIITIHRGSSVANQIDVIREYEHFGFEVCLSKYVRERGGFGPILVDNL